MTTVHEAVRKSCQTMNGAVDRISNFGCLPEQAAERLFDAAHAVLKLLAPFVEETVDDIESDDSPDYEVEID